MAKLFGLSRIDRRRFGLLLGIFRFPLVQSGRDSNVTH